MEARLSSGFMGRLVPNNQSAEIPVQIMYYLLITYVLFFFFF